MTIALVTYKGFPNLYEDDLLFQHELEKLGHKTQAVVWNTEVDWKQFDAIVVRSTWDYFLNMTEFSDWFDRIEKTGVPVLNPVPLMRWNSNKTYLRDLEKKGIPLVQTAWIDPAPLTPQLAQILAANGWNEAILKPSISGGAYLTVRVNTNNAHEHQATLDKILTFSTAMVQPFLNEVLDPGEYSFLFFGGQYQFAVLKTPKKNDFRVQFEYEGTTAGIIPSPAILAQAQKMMDTFDTPTLYARLDAIDVKGELKLMELELIEPLLYLSYHEESAAVLASKFAESVLS